MYKAQSASLQASEKTLLINNSESKITKDEGHSSYSYVAMCIVIFFYRGSVQLFSQTLNQYIYYRLNDDLNMKNSSSDNDSQINATKCGLNVVVKSNEQLIQKDAANWTTYFAIVAYGLAFISVILQGGLSDTIGRKMLLLLAPFGALIKYVIGSAVIYFRLDLYYLFIGSAFEGIGGTIYSFNLGCYAVASDVTKRNKSRSIGIGLFDLVFGVGMSSAQIGGGFLIEKVNFIYPCIGAVGFVLISIIICLCFVPETMKSKRTMATGNAYEVIGRNFKAFASNAKGSHSTKFILGFIIFSLMQFPRSRGVGLETLYVLKSPFCWGPILIGYYGAAKTFLSPFVSVGVLKTLHVCFHDEAIALIGCLSTIGYYGLLGFAYTNWMVYGAASAGMLTNMAFTTLRGVLSKATSSESQGSMFAVLAAITAGFRLASNVVLNYVYANTQNIMPGLTFFVMGGFNVIAFFLFGCLLCSSSPTKRLPTDL